MLSRRFCHASDLRAEYPQLAATAVRVTLRPQAHAESAELDALIDRARQRLAAQSEGEFPEVQAWRRVFSSMGFKPTQYRSASEALLRRLRMDGSLPTILPIIDLCNAVSVAYAVPIAVFDVDHIEGNLTVRHALGTETFATFGGEIEIPGVNEVIFADDIGQAHARRWPHKQSRISAAQEQSTEILIVSEAMHDVGAETEHAVGLELARLLTPMATTTVIPLQVDRAGVSF